MVITAWVARRRSFCDGLTARSTAWPAASATRSGRTAAGGNQTGHYDRCIRGHYDDDVIFRQLGGRHRAARSAGSIAPPGGRGVRSGAGQDASWPPVRRWPHSRPRSLPTAPSQALPQAHSDRVDAFRETDECPAGDCRLRLPRNPCAAIAGHHVPDRSCGECGKARTILAATSVPPTFAPMPHRSAKRRPCPAAFRARHLQGLDD